MAEKRSISPLIEGLLRGDLQVMMVGNAFEPGLCTSIAAMAAIEGEQFQMRFGWLEELVDKATGARVKRKMRGTSGS